MRTNIDIDDGVMRDLLEMTGLRTKKEVVDLALRKLCQETAWEDLRALRGKVEFWPGYDPEEGEA